MENLTQQEQKDNETKTNQIAWWYEMDGERKGPVEEKEIVRMIEDKSLKKDNLVWKDGMKAWLMVSETDFSEHIASDMMPPPLHGGAVKDNFIWWLAFAPLLGQIVQSIFLEITNPSPDRNDSIKDYINYMTNTDFNKFWFATLALNIILAAADEANLKKAGYDTAKLGSVFLVPVYMYKRAELLKQKNTYFWIWIVSFVITLG